MHDRRWLILSTVSVGTFMATLDGSIVNVSLPSIRTAFGIDLATVEWIVVAYLLVVGSLLLPMGRLGEVAGFRTVYLYGFAIFTVASVCCGLAPTPLVLIVFRAVQGIGAAAIMAMGPAIVARTFPPGERGRALGFNAVSVSVGLTLGPALGGILTATGSWRAIFLVNLPVGLFAIAWAARILPAEAERRRQSFDIPGAVLLSGAFFSLLLGLTEGEAWGWSSGPVLGLFGLALALGIAFVVVELRTPAPMFDLALFRIRAFSAGLASVVFAYMGLFAAMFLLPFLLQGPSGFNPIEAGLLLTPIPLTTALVAPLSGSLSDRIGSRLPASLGLAVMAIGLLLLARLPPGFSVPDLVWRLVVIGVGQGLFTSPNSAAVLSAIPRGRVGTASGTVAQMRVTGQALGIAMSGAIVTSRFAAHMAETGGTSEAARSVAQGLAIRDAFAVAAAICSIGILTSLVRGGRAEPEPGPVGAAAARPRVSPQPRMPP
jgi:EmrB/QacA subfamily drug resistance transporter